MFFQHIFYNTEPVWFSAISMATTTTTNRPTVTEDDCFKNFRTYVTGEGRELDKFYKDDVSLKAHTRTAKAMVEGLFDLGCEKEVALQLSRLILYDLVILIGLSPSEVPVFLVKHG